MVEQQRLRIFTFYVAIIICGRDREGSVVSQAADSWQKKEKKTGPPSWPRSMNSKPLYKVGTHLTASGFSAELSMHTTVSDKPLSLKLVGFRIS